MLFGNRQIGEIFSVPGYGKVQIGPNLFISRLIGNKYIGTCLICLRLFGNRKII